MAEQTKKDTSKQQKIFFAILLLGGFYLSNKYFYFPMGKKIKEIDKSLAEKKSKLDSTRKRAAQLSKLQREFDIMKEDLADTEKRLPKDKDMSSIITTVIKMMEKHGVEYKEFMPLGEVSRDYFIELPFSVTANSSLHGIARFVTEIGQLERIFTIRDLKITKKILTKEDPTSATCTFIIVTYVYK